MTTSYSIWIAFIDRGLCDLSSTIVDIGSGAGKSAVGLRDFEYNGRSFTGQYIGFDIDAEMVSWCREAFPREAFDFRLIDMQSAVYRPAGGYPSADPAESPRPGLTVPDESVDLVFSQSLFSHLLEGEIRHYLAESFRILKRGGHMAMTFFCLEDLERQGLLGKRWTFRHQLGAAKVENLRYPEAAVAYNASWIIGAAKEAGFSEVAITLAGAHQSTLECKKAI